MYFPFHICSLCLTELGIKSARFGIRKCVICFGRHTASYLVIQKPKDKGVYHAANPALLTAEPSKYLILNANKAISVGFLEVFHSRYLVGQNAEQVLFDKFASVFLPRRLLKYFNFK